MIVYRMNYEQDRLLKRIHFLLTNFDGELKTLRHEKSQREVTLKNAELRYILYFVEFLEQVAYVLAFSIVFALEFSGLDMSPYLKNLYY